MLFPCEQEGHCILDDDDGRCGEHDECEFRRHYREGQGTLRSALADVDAYAKTMTAIEEVARAETKEIAALRALNAELLEALAALIPTNVNLDHPKIMDSVVLPCDVTMGELRRARAAIARAKGVESPQ